MANYCDCEIRFDKCGDRNNGFSEQELVNIRKKIDTYPSPLKSDSVDSRWIEVHDYNQDDEDGIDIICTSAWAPPKIWALEVSKLFNCNVRIIYREDGIGFMGVYQAYNGTAIQDECIEY